MGLGTGGPLLVEPACLLYDGSRLAEQDGMTSHAEDEIGEVPMGHDLNDLWGGEVTVPADEEMGPWPVAPQIGKEPDQDHLLALTITIPTGTHQEEPYAASSRRWTSNLRLLLYIRHMDDCLRRARPGA